MDTDRKTIFPEDIGTLCSIGPYYNIPLNLKLNGFLEMYAERFKDGYEIDFEEWFKIINDETGERLVSLAIYIDFIDGREFVVEMVYVYSIAEEKMIFKIGKRGDFGEYNDNISGEKVYASIRFADEGIYVKIEDEVLVSILLNKEVKEFKLVANELYPSGYINKYIPEIVVKQNYYEI